MTRTMQDISSPQEFNLLRSERCTPKKKRSPPGAGRCITHAVCGAIRSHCKAGWALRRYLTASSGNKRIWCWRRCAGGSLAAFHLILPGDFFLGSEGTGGGGRTALRGSKRCGVDAAVSGCALKITVELQVAPRSGPGADFIPLLITVRRAGGVAGQGVAA